MKAGHMTATDASIKNVQQHLDPQGPSTHEIESGSCIFLPAPEEEGRLARPSEDTTGISVRPLMPKKNPRQSPAGGSLGGLSDDSGSEVTLNAHVEPKGALVTKRVRCGSYRTGYRPERPRGACPILVEHSIENFTTERQVLHRRPRSFEPNLGYVKVWIAGRGERPGGPRTQPVTPPCESIARD
jgi:hypothetical protein